MGSEFYSISFISINCLRIDILEPIMDKTMFAFRRINGLIENPGPCNFFIETTFFLAFHPRLGRNIIYAYYGKSLSVQCYNGDANIWFKLDLFSYFPGGLKRAISVIKKEH